jgi:hypothetical protein
MTQDEIYEMVQQSDLGFLLGDNWMLQHELEFFAKLVAAKERETCAKVCDELVNEENSSDYQNAANYCSIRIRAGGEE